MKQNSNPSSGRSKHLWSKIRNAVFGPSCGLLENAEPFTLNPDGYTASKKKEQTALVHGMHNSFCFSTVDICLFTLLTHCCSMMFRNFLHLLHNSL